LQNSFTGRHKLVNMRTASNRAGSALGFWRRLVGAAAIYALVMQPLLLAAGLQLAQASAFDNIALAQLCLHQTDNSPTAPAGQPKHPAHNHCLLCFTGAFHLLNAPDPTTVSAADFEFRKLDQSTHPQRLAWSSNYSAARPRGPPLST
jgi:hypothetical protein